MRVPLVKTIFLKELRDILRDRRTLFVMIVLPILLYPLLMIGFTQIASVQMGRIAQKQSRIAVLGKEHAPEFTAAIDTIVSFSQRDTADWRERIRLGELEATIVFSSAFSDSVMAHRPATVHIYFNSSKETSEHAKQRLEKIYEQHHQQIVAHRLAELASDTSLLRAYTIRSENIATQQQQQGAFIGRMLGYILIIMTLMGAFYPAIDLTAGEKERGTLETLLVSPANRSEIVYGKFLAVAVIALITATLNVASIGVSMAYIFGKVAGAAPGMGALNVDLFSLLLSFLLIIPLAITFAAVCLAVAVGARNYKEGQSLLTPLYSLVILPAMVSLMPGVELTLGLAAIPIVNVSLLIKEYMMGHYMWVETAIAFGSTSLLAAVSLSWATHQFKQESVIFRHAEDVRWSPFRRRRMARLGAAPSPGSAFVLVMVQIILLFQLQLQAPGWGLPKTLLITELAVILALPILLLVRGGFDLSGVLALRSPKFSAWPATFLLMLGGWLIAVELATLQHSLLPFPDDLLEQFAELYRTLAALPIGYAIFLVAILPGVCEEILCRGYLLSSFRSRFGPVAAIVLAAVLFGLLHMNPYRFIPTIWLGLMLGFLVVYTRSIYPAMFAHAGNNALSFFVEKHQSWITERMWLRVDDADYLPWPLAVAGVILTVTGFIWLKRNRGSDAPGPDPDAPVAAELIRE